MKGEAGDRCDIVEHGKEQEHTQVGTRSFLLPYVDCKKFTRVK